MLDESSTRSFLPLELASRRVSVLGRYAIALVATAVAVVVRWLLNPVLADHLPLITLFGAIAMAVWVGGYGPALLAMVLGYLACDALFIQPRVGFGLDPAQNLVGLIAYVVTCSIVIGFGEARRFAQRGTERGRELLRVTFASIGDAVITTDTDGRITFLNPVAEALTGWARQDATGRPLDAVVGILDEGTRMPVENPIATVLRDGVVVPGNHTILVAKDGTERPVDGSAAPLNDADGRVLGVAMVFRDATERRELERLQQDYQAQLEQQVQERTAELRASEERFRLLVDGTKDCAIFMLDPDGNVASWNPGAERIKQYRASEIVGQHFSRFYPPEDVQSGKLEHELRVAATEGRYAEEGWRVRKDGTRFWASVLITALRDDAGKLRGFSKVTRDITERKQAEETARRLFQEETARREAEQYSQLIERQREQLQVTLAAIRQSEARTRAIVETALDCIITMDHEGRIVEFNPAAERTFGYRRAEVLGRKMAELIIPPSLRQRHRHGLARYLVTGEGPVLNQRIEMPAVCADGSEFRVELTITTIRREGSPLFTAYLRDITESARLESRRAARLAITQILAEAPTVSDAAPRILQAICESSSWDVGAIWRLDPQSGVLRCLELWHRHDLHVAEFEAATRRSTFAPGVGLPGRIWTSRQPAWIPDVVRDANFPRGRVADREGLHGAFGFPIAIGSEFLGVIEFFSHEIREPDADLLEMMRTVGSQVGDFMQRKQLEQQLHQRVAELAESDRRKTEFLAILAHELRNPLAPLRNGLEMMRLAPHRPDVADHARRVMGRQLAQMVRLIDDLLDLSRISRGIIELRKERVDLSTVLENAVETSRPLIEASGHELAISQPPEPILLDADVTRLAQVFINLINNAAKYTDPGGHVRLAAERHGGEVVVTVADDGVGIPATMLPTIFEMFTQADNSLGRSRGGLGIGLTLVKRLVEMHGGRVAARSAGTGAGSEFIVCLPLVNEAQPRQPTTADDDVASQLSRAYRLLVVDDLRDSADTMALLLREIGHEVETAYDGEQAVTAAEEFRPNVMLLDIGLPKLNGYDVCRRIREQAWGKQIFVVALTGWGQADDRTRTDAAGFDRHLVKPVTWDALLSLLAAVPASQRSLRPHEAPDARGLS